MNTLFHVEIGIDSRALEEGLKDPRRFTEFQRIRLPYRFRPNPVIGELEFFSVPYSVFKANRSRAVSLLKAICGEMELLGGDVVTWITKKNLSHEFRTAYPDVWNTMILAAILDAARNNIKREHVLRYFAGEETIGIALARLVNTKTTQRDNFENFLFNRQGSRLDPLSREVVARLHQDAVLHATRTATNALVGQIYLVSVLGAIGFLELGGLAFLAQFVRGGTAWVAEGGFGMAVGADVPMVQALTSAFMGFIGYVQSVGEVMADGEISEDDGTKLYVAFAGIIIPGLFAGLQSNFVPAVIRRFGELALLPAVIFLPILSAIDHIVWLISSMQQLMESFELARALAAAQASGLILGDNMSEIILPAMPE